MPSTTSSSSSEEIGLLDIAFHYLGEAYLQDKRSNHEEVKGFVQQYEEAKAAKSEAEKVKLEKEAESVSSIMKDSTSTVPSDVGEDFEKLEVDSTVTEGDIAKLLKRAASRHYEAFMEDTEDQNIYLKCAALLKSDYICMNFNNSGGAISWNYPKNILIPVAIKLNDPNTSNEDEQMPGSDMRDFIAKFQDYVDYSEKASVARCRSRFPVPVILFHTKFICRSGTLAVRKGAVFEAIVKSTKPEGQVIGENYLLSCLYSYAADIVKKVQDALSIMVYGVDEMKDIDAKILKVLEIHCISDLMVENRKYHTGMWVSSSEKMNMAKYGDFCCLRMPFPGCEFFKEYSKIKYSVDFENEQKNLIYNWESPEVDTTFGIPEDCNIKEFGQPGNPNVQNFGAPGDLAYSEVDFSLYKTWDLMTLTKNYMKILLDFLQRGEGSLLIHCISGWDRTPLFISLLRISLWADKYAHNGLDVNQMAYFTLGYDWYLFGHNLPTRLRKQEEILHFCFKFLPELAGAEYSLRVKYNRGLDEHELSKILQQRKTAVEKLSALVLSLYEENTDIEPINEETFVFLEPSLH